MRALGLLGLAAALAVLAGSTAIGSHAGRAAFPGRINGRIVFNDENNDLVLVNPDGSGLVRLANTAASDTTHLVHVPSNPPGWSAGKWGEWYPDILGPDGKLTTRIAKPYWQAGWLAQHDRLMASLAAMRGRTRLVISGDLHAIGIGSMVRCGDQNLAATPITTVLSGPIGTNPTGWPSGRRGIGATPPAHIDLREEVAPIEQHGFTIADFLPDRIDLRFFKWNVQSDSAAVIDSLEPFHMTRLPRPS